ncbi:MAG TPA: family 78 glycoside hydrolase catalytic domain [Bacilli bacterium]
MLQADKLRCEYLENPIGIDVLSPRISWQLRSDARAVLQRAYQIQISEQQSFAHIIWDTGKIVSDKSLHVVLAGVPLKARTRYHYRVRIWSDGDETSDWAYAYWETGLLAHEAWQAEWISAPLAPFSPEMCACPLFRRGFMVSGEVETARIYATALGLYELRLNGRRVGNSYFTPGWTSGGDRLHYQTYDVTNLLQAGENALGAILGNGRHKSYHRQDEGHSFGERPALLLQLHIVYRNGREDVIVSDGNWQTADSPIMQSIVDHGETYDARLEKQGWDKTAFGEDIWRAADVLPYPKSLIVAQVNEPIRKIEKVKPVAIITTPQGETVLDMGRSMVGWVRFTIRGEAGQEVSLEHGESLDRDGNFARGPLHGERQIMRYILKGGAPETFQPHFTFQRFRYVKLSGFGESPDLADFAGIVLHADMESVGYFVCSEPQVNKLLHQIVWEQKGDFLDFPGNSLRRDARTATYFFNVAPFFTNWLHDWKSVYASQDAVQPAIRNLPGNNEALSPWDGAAAVVYPWVLYECYGDVRILEQQYESIQAWTDYVRAQTSGKRVESEEDFIAFAFYAYSLSLAAKTAAILNKNADAQVYEKLHADVAEAFRRSFAAEAEKLPAPALYVHALALMFGLIDGAEKDLAIRKLHDGLSDIDGPKAAAFTAAPYLFFALSRFGEMELAYKLLLQTVPEPTPRHPNCLHPYAIGTIGEWLFRCVAGIDTDEDQPGYKHIHIHPQPGPGLAWAEAKLETMYGTVGVGWRRTGYDTMEYSVMIPPNTTATVFLPNAKADELLESGAGVRQADGISSVTPMENGVYLCVGSGNYHFTLM